MSGVVSATQAVSGAVEMDLTLLAPPTSPASTVTKKEKGKGKKKNKKPAAAVTVTAKGILPHAHLGDHASVCGPPLAAALVAIPGTAVEELVVLEVDKTGVPTVSIKPLLLAAAAASAAAAKRGSTAEAGTAAAAGDEREAFIPKSAEDVSPGDLVAGFVSRVESFGVFVKFLGRFAALCPRSMVADRVVEDPSGMFTEGDSVR